MACRNLDLASLLIMERASSRCNEMGLGSISVLSRNFRKKPQGNLQVVKHLLTNVLLRATLTSPFLFLEKSSRQF